MTTMTILLAAVLGGETTLSGELRHEPRLEGGTWILRSAGKDWCLHGVPAGFRSGDRVEAVGRIRADRVCIHMVGPVFEVTSMRKSGTDGTAAVAGPTGCEICGSCVCRCRGKRKETEMKRVLILAVLLVAPAAPRTAEGGETAANGSRWEVRKPNAAVAAVRG